MFDPRSYEGVGRIKHGQLAHYNAHMLRAFMQQNDGRQFQYVIRTMQQADKSQLYGYYWGDLIARIRDAIRETGTPLSKSEAHDIVVQRSPIMYEQVWDGVKLRLIPRDFYDLTTDELRAYMDDATRFALNELHIPLHEPTLYNL